jgi:hypothetical protein
MNTQILSQASLRKPPRSMRGGSFAELMLATLIVGTTIVASTASLSESAEVYQYFAEGPHEALMLAQEIHEAAILMPWEADPDSVGVFGEDIDTIWDLDDATFKPPRSAEYEVIVSHPTWTQRVSVQTVDLANPTVEVNPDTFEGDMLTELKVTILNGPTEVGVYPWWLSEQGSDDS